MKIVMGSDHGGFELKQEIKDYLISKGVEVADVGTDSVESVDYPQYAKLVCEEILQNKAQRGILFCGTGIGIGIAANKIDGIRCAIVHDEFTAKMSKQHNDANVISMGGRVLDVQCAKKIVDAYLEAEFEGGRHQKRVDQIMEIEKEN